MPASSDTVQLYLVDLADATIRREGVVLRVARSKTDQAGAGWLLGVNRGSAGRLVRWWRWSGGFWSVAGGLVLSSRS